MTTRRHLLSTGAAVLAAMATGLAPRRAPAAAAVEAFEIRYTDAEWRARLTPQQYAVLRQAGTERPGSSPLNDEKRDGTFVCAACFQPLFDSRAKYESGTGWPSFREALPGAVATKTDTRLLHPRTEYHCSHCGGHQGHVFDDGPPPQGTRYCNNGLALVFVPRGEALPALRG